MNVFERARWGDLYNFLADGDPPLIFMLLGINTLFFLLFIYRRLKSKNKLHPTTAYFVQFVLIAANLAVLMQKEWMPYVKAIRMAI
jgi:hypothetical protein